MDKNTHLGPENISTRTAILFVFVAGLVILSLLTGYFLGLAWLLTLFAPLTYAQAATVAVACVASGFWILARWPKFEIVMILLNLVAFAVLALVEVLVARLGAFLTPLSVWEASLLLVAIAALLLLIVVQTIVDSGAGYGIPDDEDDWEASSVARRLSPDMYVLKPQETQTPAPRRPRSPRRRSKRKTDDTDTD